MKLIDLGKVTVETKGTLEPGIVEDNFFGPARKYA